MELNSIQEIEFNPGGVWTISDKLHNGQKSRHARSSCYSS